MGKMKFPGIRAGIFFSTLLVLCWGAAALRAEESTDSLFSDNDPIRFQSARSTENISPQHQQRSMDEWYELAYQRLAASPTNRNQHPHIPIDSLTSRLVALNMGKDGILVFGDPKEDIVWFGWQPDPTIQKVQVNIFDIMGERLATLSPTSMKNLIAWKIQDMTGGIFYYEVTIWKTAGQTISPLRKIVIFR